MAWGRHPGKKYTAEDGKEKVRMVSYEALFVDLRTMLYALTGERYSLGSAAKAFLGEGEQKGTAEVHGVITADYIAYNRQDVYTTLHLYNRAIGEWKKLGIRTPPHRLFSTASVAKAYLRDMGVLPRLDVQPDFPDEVMGYAMNAYFGGRVETRIRKSPVPVVYADFLSMYPTVNALMGLWNFMTAKAVEVQEATEEVQTFLDNLTTEALFDPETWKRLPALVSLEPNGDVLPVRGRYGETDNIGTNPYWGSEQWYALPDVAASKLMSGKRPRIIRALRLVAVGELSMQPVKLAGVVEIDPTKEDFFRALIEERYKVKQGLGGYADLSEAERERVQLAMKITANAGSYGITGERNRKPYGRPQTYSIFSDQEIEVTVRYKEQPGSYYFPPLACLITAAARLMLALLETAVKAKGGCYAAGDTDSMHIVADQENYEMAIEGRGADRSLIPQTIRVLSWAEVDEIVQRFSSLNPYPSIPGSVLKIEDENYQDGERRRVWCYAISSKRYALLDDEGQVVKCKESGLGDFFIPNVKKEELVEAVWDAIIHGKDLGQEYPWGNARIISQRSISTAYVWKKFDRLNAGRSWRDRVKPFNFYLRATDIGNPLQHISVFTPFEKESDVSELNWWRLEDGETAHGVALKALSAYVLDYALHPEKPYCGPDGLPCGVLTVGALQRRAVASIGCEYKGKMGPVGDDIAVLEDDEVEPQIIHTELDGYLKAALDVLADMPIAEVAAVCGVTPEAVKDWRRGRRIPNCKEQVMKLGIEQAEQVTGETGIAALDAYARMKAEWIESEKELLESLPAKEIMRRYGCSRRQAYRYKSGTMPPFRSMVIARLHLGLLLSTTDDATAAEH